MASTPPPVSGNTANITVTLAANGVAVFDTAHANLNLSNLVVQTENVVTLNVTGIISANASPVTNTVTRVATMLCANMVANTTRTSTTVLANEANLTITINETGTYLIGGQLYFQSQNANTGAGSSVDLGGGSATVNTGTFSYLWASGGSDVTRSPTSAFPIASTPPNFPVALTLGGLMTINSAGTFIPRYAQQTSTANALVLLANSYIVLTKIG